MICDKPAWCKANNTNIDDYKSDLEKNIQNIKLDEDLLLCIDVHCKNEMHINECDRYCIEILDAITSAVKDNIPSSSNPKEKIVAGWTDEIKEYQKEAQFCHALWISAKRPNNNNLHWAMKQSRNQFHYAFRRAKRNEESLRNNKFIQCCLDGKIDNLIKEIKKKRGKSNSNSSIIDGKVGDDAIADHLSNVYEELFNSINSDDEMNDLLNDIKRK